MIGEIRLQEVDMGIALCHVELASAELGSAGSWQQCPGLAREADALAYRIVEQYREKDRAVDASTEHGKSQGALLRN
jgi:predicted secreted Zn-dependent protease